MRQEENDDDGDGDEEEAENDDIFCCISLLYLLICAHCLLSVFMQPYIQIGFLKLQQLPVSDGDTAPSSSQASSTTPQGAVKTSSPAVVGKW